jgi:hypothetical protein
LLLKDGKNSTAQAGRMYGGALSAATCLIAQESKRMRDSSDCNLYILMVEWVGTYCPGFIQ